MRVVIILGCVGLLVGVGLWYATWRFSQDVDRSIVALLASANKSSTARVTTQMLDGLPAPVRRWLENAHVVGREMIETVYLEQKGAMRTTPKGTWMQVEAEQYNTIANPGFIWRAKVNAAPWVDLVGKDSYVGGRGQMLIKLMSLFTVADAKGKETDQGALLRYLAETVWFPSAALSDYIDWEAIDDSSAKATMTYGGISASGIFRFNAHGDVVGFEAQRYFENKGKYSLETWLVRQYDHKVFDGVRMPARAEVSWKLKTGVFTWFKLEISSVEYNLFEPK